MYMDETLKQRTNDEGNSDSKETTNTVAKEKPRRGGKRKPELAPRETDEPAKIRVQLKRNAKEGRDFKCYAKEEKPSIEIEDSSFAYFMTDTLEKSKIFFSNSDVEGKPELDDEEDKAKYSLPATINKDPTSNQEAMASPDGEHWKRAVGEEFKSMYKNKIWILVDTPYSKKEQEKANIIDSQWVFKKKVNVDSKVTNKARLVILGLKDRTEYELRETYAPFTRVTLFRSILVITSKYNLDICQIDSKTALLNEELEESIYMECDGPCDPSHAHSRHKTMY